MLTSVLQVALGGAVGSVLRFLAFQIVPAPWGTMAVNVLGSFLIGLLFVPAARLGLSVLLLTGVLGGFTTFSAFSLDAALMWNGGRPVLAFVYVAGSVLMSLVAVAAGAGLFQILQERVWQ